MAAFVDGIAISRKFKHGSIKPLAGVRNISFRQAGDVNRDGVVVTEEEVIGERIKAAWIQGSHETRLQLKSDGTTLLLSGNPGRFGRSDNLFNLDLQDTLDAANRIAASQGFPADAFIRGEADPYTISQLSKMNLGKSVPESPWSGARVWSIHLTQNYETGSPQNVKPVIDWLNTQSVARVKKSRLGPTTVVWGSIRYCQTEVYGKAEEMMAHCKTPEQKNAMRQNPAYIHALEKGIIRVEVKCAYDFLKEHKLTYLGNWDMGTVERIFADRTQVIQRCNLQVNDDDWLEAVPKASRVYALAWMAGIDVASTMSRATFYRHAKVLRDFGIDIAEVRDIRVMRPSIKTIPLQVAELPEWYRLAA